MYTKAPMRISFGGGNTDVEPYRSGCGGMTLGMAIQKYAYAKHAPVVENSEKALIRAIQDKMMFDPVLNGQGMSVMSEAKPFSGLGASGAIAVSVIALISKGRMSKKDMAKLAFEVERIDLDVKGGMQDQIFAAFGGFNYLEFGDGRFDILPMPNNGFASKLEEKTLIVYVGEREDNIMIHEDEARRTEQNEDILDNIKDLGNDMRMLAKRGKFEDFAVLLNESWIQKKSLSPLVSTAKIEELSDELMKNGALGTKVTGAGGGGHLMILCDSVHKVWERCIQMGYNPERVKIDWNGVEIID